jgi:hypothetical protein
MGMHEIACLYSVGSQRVTVVAEEKPQIVSRFQGDGAALSGI